MSGQQLLDPARQEVQLATDPLWMWWQNTNPFPCQKLNSKQPVCSFTEQGVLTYVSLLFSK
jgi:hypothetical protein